jgi:hypothetical protein
MNASNPHLDREQYLSNLHDSDETLEELLSSGADLDDLIEAGVVEEEIDSPPHPKLPPKMMLDSAVAPLLSNVDFENF